MSTTLESLSERMDRMESSLARITELLEGRVAPPAPANTGSAALSQAASDAEHALTAVHGHEELSEQLSSLLLQLGEPETLTSLTRIAALAPKLEYAAYFAAAGPELLEDAMDAANERIREQGLEPYDVQRRLDEAARTLINLTETETLSMARRLTGMVPAYLPMMEAAAEAMRQRTEHEGSQELQDRMVEALIQLSDPDTQESLIRIACLAPQLEYAAYFAAAGPELLEEAMEMTRSKAEEHGLDTTVIMHRLSQATDLLFVFTGTDQVEFLRQIGQRSPHLIPVLKASTHVLEQRSALEGEEQLESRLVDTFLELSDPETLESLTRIAALAPKLEYAAYFAAAGPELLDEVMHTVRAKAAENGIETVDARLEAAMDAAVTMSTPATLRGIAEVAKILAAIAETEDSTESLQRMVTRLPRLERTLGQVERALDTIEEAAQDSGLASIEDLEIPAVAGLKLLNVATNPATEQALETVVRLAPDLARIAEPVMQTVANVEPKVFTDAIGVLTSPEVLKLLTLLQDKAPALIELLDAVEISPETVRFLRAANQATAAAVAEPPRKIGTFGLLGALGDPDVQRAVGFGVNLSRHLSQEMAGSTALENK